MKTAISFTLVMTLLLGCILPVNAENGIDGKQEKSIGISYTVKSSYELSLPPVGFSGSFGLGNVMISKAFDMMRGDEAQSSFDLLLDNILLEPDTMLRVTVKSENCFSLKLPNGVSIPYTLNGAEEDGTVLLVRSGETSAKKTISIILSDVSQLKFAGTYYDQLTFDCEIIPDDTSVH